MANAGTGVQSFLMMGIETQVPDSQVGLPSPGPGVNKTLPSAVTAALISPAAAGNVEDGAHDYAVTDYCAGGESLPSAVVGVTVADKATNGKVAISAIPLPRTGATGRKLYRSEAGLHTLKLLATLGTTEATYTDNIADSGLGATAPTASTFPSNWGLVEFPVEASDPDPRADTVFRPDEIVTTGLGMPRQLAGLTSFPRTYQDALRTCSLAPIQATFCGNPTVTRDGSSNAWQLDYPLSDDAADAISLFGLGHKGSKTTPILWRGGKFAAIELAADGQKEAKLKATGLACNDTEFGFGIPDAGNTGYTGGAYLMGQKNAALRAAATSLTVEVSAIDAVAGTVTVTTKIDSGALSTATSTLYYDLATGQQTEGCELYDDNGPLGLDEEKVLDPLLFYVDGSADCADIDVGDSWVFPIGCQIPGTASGNTGLARVTLAGLTPMFGIGRIQLLTGASSADTIVNLDGALSLKLSRNITPQRGHGRNARVPRGMNVNGYVAVELDFETEFNSRGYEQLMRWGTTNVARVLFEGPVISASTSRWRETVRYDIGQMIVASISSPIPGPGIIKSKVKMEAEIPVAGSYLVPMIRTGYNWSFPV